MRLFYFEKKCYIRREEKMIEYFKRVYEIESR